MNPTRKTKYEDLALSVSYRRQLAHLLPQPLVEERLAQLQAFVRQLKDTPAGQDDLRRRAKRFGVCRQSEGETASQFYGRLRKWLDGDIEGQAAAVLPSGRSH